MIAFIIWDIKDYNLYMWKGYTYHNTVAHWNMFGRWENECEFESIIGHTNHHYRVVSSQNRFVE